MDNTMPGFDALFNPSMERPKPRAGIPTQDETTEYEFNDSGTVIQAVERVRERTPRRFSAYTMHIPAGTSARLVGEDQTRARIVICNAGTEMVYVGSPTDVGMGLGFALGIGATFEPEVTDEIAAAPSSSAEAVVGVWVEFD